MSEQQRYHHPFSPSTLNSLEACPSYEGTQTSHPRAIAGTLAHKVTETQVDDNLLSDDDAEAAAECMAFYSQRRQLLEASGAPVTELSETYLSIDEEDTTAGYFDKAIIDCAGTYAEMFDWKFGAAKITECSENLQSAAYVLGLFKHFPKLQTVLFHFKQPALALVSSHTFKRSDIPRLYLRIRVVVARARKARLDGNFESARPACAVCVFCRHCAICPKVTDFVLRVGKKFSPLQIPSSVTPSDVQNPNDIALGIRLALVVKTWAESFRAVATDRVLRGAPVPTGYTLESRNGNRKIIDPIAFKVLALERLTEDEYATASTVSLGAVEKMIGDKAQRGFKKAAIQEFKSVLEESNAVEKGDAYCLLKADMKGE